MKIVNPSILNENLSNSIIELTLGEISKKPLTFFDKGVCDEITDILVGVFGFSNGHFYVDDLKASRSISFLWDDVLKNGTSILIPKSESIKVPTYLYSLRTPQVNFMSDRDIFSEYTTLIEAFELIFDKL